VVTRALAPAQEFNSGTATSGTSGDTLALTGHGTVSAAKSIKSAADTLQLAPGRLLPSYLLPLALLVVASALLILPLANVNRFLHRR